MCECACVRVQAQLTVLCGSCGPGLGCRCGRNGSACTGGPSGCVGGGRCWRGARAVVWEKAPFLADRGCALRTVSCECGEGAGACGGV